jgi:hypothetical protein
VPLDFVVSGLVDGAGFAVVGALPPLVCVVSGFAAA